MRAQSWLGYLAALLLGMLAFFPYFHLGGVAQSKLAIWAKLIIYAALLFSPLGFLGRPRFRLVPIFAFSVVAVSSIVWLPGSLDLWGGMQIVAEPILCIWLGASLAWIALHFIQVPRKPK